MIKNIRKVSNIRYASIREMDISNGEGIGVALFVQGCHFHCYNCFNQETWDFKKGKEWTQETENKFIELCKRPFIDCVSILGGEPLADENLDGVLHLVNKFRLSFPNKSIWLYSGYTWEECQPFSEEGLLKGSNFAPNLQKILYKRQQIISQCNVMVDGRYIDSQRDITLKWRGSSNQRVIDIRKSLQKGEIVLWTE